MEVNAKLVGIRIMQKRKEYGYSQEKLAETDSHPAPLDN